jgi:hypothetical protein
MRAKLPAGSTWPRSPWFEPLVWWAGVALFNLVTALLRGVSTAREAGFRWWVEIDDQIPELTARWLLDGAHGLLLQPHAGDAGWHASDRGPLQPILLLWAGRWSTEPVPAYVTGVVVNSLWVVGLWWFLRAVRVEEASIRAAVILVALTGSIWMNTVYPWPKLLAGGLALGCAAAILFGRPVLAGVLGALAVLAHGAALVALVALIPWVVMRLGKRGALLALVSLGVVYAPWFVFTKTVDPPGDRVIKWHLAGTDMEKPDHRSAVRAIVDSYRSATIADLARYKLDNARLALGDPTVYDSARLTSTPKWTEDGVGGKLRSYQVQRIIWAPGVLLLGLLFGWRRVPRTVWAMLGAWLAAYVLIEWGGNYKASTWLHTAPMCLVIGWVAACALASPRWMLPVQVVVFVGLWFLAPPVF